MPTSATAAKATWTVLDRVLTFEGAVDDTQKQRMAEIAERTPVTLTLKKGLQIRTRLG